MKITITTPSLKIPHGGTRVLNEWANHLSRYHDVTLFVQDGVKHCSWMPVKVKMSNRLSSISLADLVIIGSPHSIHLERKAKKAIIFMQMAEHMFTDRKIFNDMCYRFYNSPNLLLSISEWNIKFLLEQGRKGKIVYIGNGINLEDFPLNTTAHKDNIVLVEGWECGNNKSKDVDHIAPQVAERLRDEGYRILAYSQKPLTTMSHVPHEYYHCPTLAQINDLYTRAKILLKASKYDARSTSPIEAMTKGTPTVRAIIQGDDDLVDQVNCLKVDYDAQKLYNAAKFLLTNPAVYDIIRYNCIDHVVEIDWNKEIQKINDILVKYVEG
jgi:glycosyltransferase involved in cell wall biosynthesis